MHGSTAGSKNLRDCLGMSRRRRALMLMEALERRQLLSANVLQWHNDPMGTGQNTGETTLTPANVNSTMFGKLSNTTVAGTVYAQPLYVSGLNMGALGTHNVAFIVTENNDVYAYSVDNPAAPSLLWHDNSTNAGLTTLGTAIPAGSSGGPNEVNFSGGQIGITGTPIIDLNSSTMYFDSTARASGSTTKYVHTIYALNILNGATRASITLEKHGDNVGNSNAVEVSVPGNATDSIAGTLYFTPAQQLQRPGLTIMGGNLYVAYGSYGDTDPYHGWVIGFDTSTLAVTGVFCTTPNKIAGASGDGNKGEGAIWQGGAALTTDGTNLYMVTANGDFEPATNAYSDSVLSLTVDPTTTINSPGTNGYGLKLASFFAPSNQAVIGSTAVDLDLGSTGAILLPDQGGPNPHELVLSSKSGAIYLVNRDNLGGYTPDGPDQIVQELAINGSNASGVGHSLRASPAYFNNAVYFFASGDTLKSYSLTNGLMSTGAIGSSSMTSSVGLAPTYGSTPSISANGTSNGIVWVTVFSGSAQVLAGFDASTMQLLYASNVNSSRDGMGGGPHFSEPTVAGGMVFDAGNGFFTIYGLLPTVTTSPATPPQNTAVSNTTGGQLTVTWTGTSNTNEYEYDIFRSTSSTSGFTQVGTVGVDGTKFTDTNVTVGTKYFYEVFAKNVIGSSSASALASGTVLQMSTVTDWYHFDEGAGTSTADSAGSLSGTLNGSVSIPTWVAGIVGQNALNFNGVGGVALDTTSSVQGATVLTSASLSTTLGSSSTMIAWIKTTQVGNDDPTKAPAITGAVATTANGAQDSGNDVHWGYIDGEGHIGIAVDGFNGVRVGTTNVVLNPNNIFGVVSKTVINDGNWHSVAFTRNASNGLLQVFVDGVLQGAFYADAGTKTSSFNLIGAQTLSGGGGTGHLYFIGTLDELHIYNQVLSAAQIAALGPIALAANPLSASSIQLSWTNVANLAASIEIDRAVGTGGFAPLVMGLSGTLSAYTDTGLIAGTTYTYQIKVVNTGGTSVLSNTASAIPAAPHVVAGYAFYRGSVFNVSNVPGDNADDNAIAPDKTALLSNQVASFANYTSYASGLNGIMVDITGDVGTLSAADFHFATGGTGGVDNVWNAAPGPAPIIITRPLQGNNGTGTLGSTRVEILFNDQQIANEWLQITVLGNANTGLAADSVLYLGNAIGEAGNDPAGARVDAVDQLVARAAVTGGAAISNRADFNRDGQVDAADETIARTHMTWALSQLDLIQAPGLAGEAQPVAASEALAPASTILQAEAVPAAANQVSSNPGAVAVDIPTTAVPLALYSTPVIAVLRPSSIEPVRKVHLVRIDSPVRSVRFDWRAANAGRSSKTTSHVTRAALILRPLEPLDSLHSIRFNF